MAVYDINKSVDSRDFINRLTTSDYFDLVKSINSESEIRGILDKNVAQTVIVIPNDFSKNIHSNKEAKVQILIQGIQHR